MKSIWILLTITLLALSGCGDTVDSLAEDSERRNQILKACADMGAASMDDELCKMAARAQVEAAKRSIKGAFE